MNGGFDYVYWWQSRFLLLHTIVTRCACVYLLCLDVKSITRLTSCEEFAFFCYLRNGSRTIDPSVSITCMAIIVVSAGLLFPSRMIFNFDFAQYYSHAVQVIYSYLLLYVPYLCQYFNTNCASYSLCQCRANVSLVRFVVHSNCYAFFTLLLHVTWILTEIIYNYIHRLYFTNVERKSNPK